MSGSLGCLVDVERHDAWQASLIFDGRRYSDQDGEEARERQDSVAVAQARLADSLGDGRLATAQYLLETLEVANGLRALDEIPHLPNPLTPGEMSHLPAFVEQQLAEQLHEELTPSEAANPAVWTICHAAWISRGDFGPNLATVFCDGPKADSMEARTRNFLRRTGGLRRVRGNTSPLVDCPISAAWWRYRVAREVSSIARTEGRILDIDDAHEVLRLRTVWENLVGMSLRQVTAVSSPKARAATIAVFEQHQRESNVLTRGQVQGAIRELARLSYGYSLWHVSWSSMLTAAQRGIENGAADDGLVDDEDSGD